MRRIRVAAASGLLLAATIPSVLPAVAGAPDPGPDYNGDGYADLAIGVPYEDVSGWEDAGAVHVIYGSVDGLDGDVPIDDRFLTQNSSGMQETAEPGDRFGHALASGDFDGDGYDDLAIGAPSEDVATGSVEVADGGIVHILYGSFGGVTANRDLLLSQDTSGIADAVESGDFFGYALESAQLGGGRQDDLVVGAPFDSVGGRSQAGVVNVILGAPTGLTATGNKAWSQDTAGVAGIAESGDRFGWSLTAGELGKGAAIDLVVGAPYEDSSSEADIGAVNVIYGSDTGLDPAGSQQWTQDSSGIAGASEPDDRFGFALVAADFGKTSHADLAIGSPYEDVDDLNAGVVNVIYGTATGLTSSGNQMWHQDTPGIGGDSETRDEFGWSLSAADFGKGARADLAIGVAGETNERTGVDDAETGAVNVIYGGSGGLAATGQEFWWQDSPGIDGDTELGDEFGKSLAAANFGNGSLADLAVGVPGEGNEGDSDDRAGAVNVIYGESGSSGLGSPGAQFWWQASDTLGDSAESYDDFGAALAN